MTAEVPSRYHVHKGRRAHLGDFEREIDRHVGWPYWTLCGQSVAASFIEGYIWTPPDCARCVAVAARRDDP